MHRIIPVILVCILLNQNISAQFQDTTKTSSVTMKNNFSSDSLEVSPKHKKLKRIPVFTETVVGFTAGTFSAIGSIGFAYAIIKPEGDMAGLSLLPAAYIGFIIGSSTGIYLVTHSDNPNTSWCLTTCSGLFGAVSGFGLSRILPRNNFLPMLVLPFIFEILYVNLLVPDYEGEVSYMNHDINPYLVNKNKIYNLYEQSKIIDMKVFSIRF